MKTWFQLLRNTAAFCRVSSPASATRFWRCAERLAWILVALAFSLSVFAQDLPPTPPLPAPDATPWAKPLAGGPIRALIIAPQYTRNDAVELARRVDLEYEFFPVWDAYHITPDGAGADAALAQLTRLLGKKWDVIIAGAFEFGLLPNPVVETLASKIAAGAGLVLAHHRGGSGAAFDTFLNGLDRLDSNAAVTDGLGAEFAPEWEEGLGFVSLAAHGAGLVAELAYRGERPAAHFLIPAIRHPQEAVWEHFDTYLALAARTVLWAAKRGPEIRIEKIEAHGPATPDESEIPPFLPEAFTRQFIDPALGPFDTVYSLQLDQPAPRDYQVRLQLREPGRGHPVTFEPERPFRRGTDRYEVRLNAWPGRYYMDAWLLRGGKTECWRTEVFELARWPVIESVEFGSASLRPHDVMEITVSVPPPSMFPRPCTVYARATDTWGRRVSERYVVTDPNQPKTTVRLEFADLIGDRVKFDIFALPFAGRAPAEGDLLVADHAYGYAPVYHGPRAPAFELYVRAEGSAEYNARNYLAALAALGVSGAVCPPGDAPGFYLSEAGLASIPVIALGAAAPECAWLPGDPEAIRARAMNHADTQWHAGRARALFEPPTLEGPGAEACLTGFRRLMRAKYGEIETLNAAWESGFVTWDAVTAPALDELRWGLNPAPWLDWRHAQAAALANALALGRDGARAIMPDGAVGLRLDAQTAASHTAEDQFAAVDFIFTPYDPLGIVKARSLARRGAAGWVETGADVLANGAARGSWLAWRALFEGASGLVLPEAFGSRERAGAYPLLTPDGAPTPDALALMTTVESLRNQFDTLLLSAQRIPAPIAVYNSPASQWVTEVDEGFAQEHQESQRMFAQLLDDLVYAYDFVSEAALRTGGVDRYALLILPGAVALSDEELDALDRFVTRGGRLLADVLPGVYDENGFLRSPAEAAALWGAAPFDDTNPEEPAPLVIQFRRGETLTLPAAALGGPLAPDEAQALGAAGERAVWLERRKGGGWALLLNHTLGYERQGESGSAVRAVMDTLLEDLGLERALPLRERPEPPFEGRLTQWRFGSARIYGALRDLEPVSGAGGAGVLASLRRPFSGSAQTVTLNLEKKSVVYDLMTGLPVARPRRLPLRAAPAKPALVSQLPYRVTALELTSVPTAGLGQRIPLHVQVVAKGGAPGDHLVVITVDNLTAGQTLRHYRHALVCENGEGGGYIPLALNEAPGIYRVRARDALTGIEGVAMVQAVNIPAAP